METKDNMGLGAHLISDHKLVRSSPDDGVVSDEMTARDSETAAEWAQPPNNPNNLQRH